MPAVATADGALQATADVFQADRHAVDLGLDPEVRAAGHPVPHGHLVELGEAGVRQRVGQGAGAAGERFGRCAGLYGEALAPEDEAGAGLIVELVRHGTAAVAVVGVVPLAQALGERRQLGAGAGVRPVGAGRSERGKGEQADNGKRDPAGHRGILARWAKRSSLGGGVLWPKARLAKS